MIDLLKRMLKADGSGVDNASGIDDHGVRIAACALLLEMAKIDEKFSDDEREMILSILKGEYGISDQEAEELAEEAEKEQIDSLDVWRFTRSINENFSKEEKIRIVELLWRIVYVDGKLNKHEDYLMHSTANLLNLSHQELIEAKLKVLYG
jgi:uncharacterized tellurite resistance protein B-like protein